MRTEMIAMICHEANRAYCETLDDMSQLPWERAPDWQKQSAINGVEYLMNDPTAGPEAVHQSWLEEKRRDGWKFGAVKDPDKKEHPCFVPYNELPVEQRTKDHLFRAIALTCLGIDATN